MKDKRRLVLGGLVFALMFFYVGVRIYFVFIHVRSYDGWTGRDKTPGGPIYITNIDPNGPATALRLDDEILAINGISTAQDPEIINYNHRVPPGTTYIMTLRRNGQVMAIPLTTVVRRPDSDERAFTFIHLIFVITGLAVFLLKPDNQQAWQLALMLGTFMGLFQWYMPLVMLGRWMEMGVVLARILSLWSLPLFSRFFLNFPDRSPILRRWPKLEKYLNWPFYLCVLPYLGGRMLPAPVGKFYFSLPVIRWLDRYSWFNLLLPVLAGYLVVGLAGLFLNYRVANQDARRRLRVVLVSSGISIMFLLLVIGTQFLGIQERVPWLNDWLGTALSITLPLIPISFAYAIIRHKVIPISLIIRRGLRYLLVSRGSVLLLMAGVSIVMFFVLDTFFNYLKPSTGRTVGIISSIVAIVVWQLARVFHTHVVAPKIDKLFFRQSYDAQQIISDLAESLRATTSRPQLLELVATKIQSALHTTNVTILLRDGARGDYHCAYSCEYSFHNRSAIRRLIECRLPHDSIVASRLAESGQPIELDGQDFKLYPQSDNGSPRSLSKEELEALQSLDSSMLSPITSKEGLRGIISLGPHLGDLPFSGQDKRLLLSISGPASFALENIRLIEQLIEDAERRKELEAENERRSKEMEEARQLQLSMLPKNVPQLPHLEIAAFMKTATQVGGDYYDFHLSEDGTLTVAVGDATGHGLKASTMVTAAKSLFEAFALQHDLTQIFHQTSCALKRMNLRSMFMAMTIIKVKGHLLKVSIAGMPPVLAYRAATRTVEEIAIRGLPLGSISNYSYRQQELTIATGDVVALMSDGLPERFNIDNEMLDYQPIKHAFAAVADRSPQAIIEHLVQIGDAWAGGRPQDDDVTFVVLKVTDPLDSANSSTPD